MSCSGAGSCGADEVHCTEEDFRAMHETIDEIDRWMADMRRYLYRNVACEAQKLSGLEKHMPDVRGWT